MPQPLPRHNWTQHARQDQGAVFSAVTFLTMLSTQLQALGWDVVEHLQSGVLSALGCTPPEAAVADLRIIIACRNSSESITYCAPDSGVTTNRVLVGICKGISPGQALSDWRAASPYGEGTFSGYWLASSNVTVLRYLLTRTNGVALSFYIDNGTTGIVGCETAGAVIDPESDFEDDCETSGYVYGMATVANTPSAGSSWNQSDTHRWLVHNNTSGNNHFGCWLPRTSTWTFLTRAPAADLGLAASTALLPMRISGAVACQPLYAWQTLATPNRVVGRVIGLFQWRSDIHGRTVEGVIGGVTGTAGYVSGSDLANPTQALFYTARDNRAGA